MVRFIAAIDSKLGVANDENIPWLGKIPSDTKYYRKVTEGGTVLMGYGTYEKYPSPLPDRRNVVATSSSRQLRNGFESTKDGVKFLHEFKGDIWVLGGAGLFSSTFNLADELYITQLQGDFKCTKFFPEFKQLFTLKSQSKPISENGITYNFQIWSRS